MVNLFHVWKYFDRRPALCDVTVHIGKGEMVLLMGPSGSGKSTLLKLLFRAELPDEGQVLVQDRNLSKLKPRDVPELRRKMGLVFQDFRLMPKKTVYENVALPLLIEGMTTFAAHRKVKEALRSVGLEVKREVRPDTLSAGELQRSCIARAIVNNPLLLIADEPTGNLDPRLTGEILEVFKTINARGTTVIIASHNPQLREQLRCRLLTLIEGKLESEEVPAR